MENIFKTKLNIFNGIHLVQGLILIAVCSWHLSKSLEYEYITNIGIGVQGMLLIVGCLTVVCAAFAICTATEYIKTTPIYLKLFLAFLIILLVAGFSTSVAGFVLQGQLKYDITYSLTNLQDDYGKNAAHNYRIDKLQQDLNCCGAADYTDWFSIGSSLCQDSTSSSCVPKSCCKTDFASCTFVDVPQLLKNDAEATIFTQGCVDPLVSVLTRNLNILLGFGIFSSAINAFGLIIVAYRSWKRLKQSGPENQTPKSDAEIRCGNQMQKSDVENQMPLKIIQTTKAIEKSENSNSTGDLTS